MKEKTKRILSLSLKIILIVIFMLSAAAVIFTASGYKIEIKSKKVIQTSMIVIKVLPRDSDVKINGEIQSKDNTIRAANLQPGKYIIDVSRANYRNWENEVLLDAGQTALFEDIVLFLKNPLIESVSSIDQSNYSSRLNRPRTNDNIQVKNNKVYNELYFNEKLITRISGSIANAQLYPDDAHISFISDNKLHIIDIDGKNDNVLFKITKDSPYVFLDGGTKVLFQEGMDLKIATIR